MSNTQLVVSPKLDHKLDKYFRYVNTINVVSHLFVVAGGRGGRGWGGVVEYCASQNATPLHGCLQGTDLLVCSYDSKFSRKFRSSQLLHFGKMLVSRHLFHYIVTIRSPLQHSRRCSRRQHLSL